VEDVGVIAKTNRSEVVYILTNPAMPDLIKIGRTCNLEERVRSLSSRSGVPVAFEVFYACEVEDSCQVESRVHEGFGDSRVNPKREFFRLNPERVLSILKLVELKDVTPLDDIVEDDQDIQTLAKERKRRPSFKFSLADIPVGSLITFVRDQSVFAKVFDDRRIEFEGEVTSLNKATLAVLSRDYGKNWGTARGPDYWVYNNETLTERKIRFEDEE